MIHGLLQIFIYLIIIDIILSYFPQMMSQKWARELHRIMEIPQKPIRELFPRDLPIDPAPIILIILIEIIMYLL
jgi:YggT family protein